MNEYPDPATTEPVSRAIVGFAEHFDGKPAVAGAAPGRVNLIGEHTDYNDGFVLPIAIERRTVVVGRTNDSQRCRVVSTDMEGEQTTFMNDDSLAPGKTTWANYVKGVVAQFMANGHRVPSFDAVIASDVPLGGGLSSSASLEVAMASFIEALMGVQVEPTHKALWCQKAEHDFAGMPCGIMDQFIAVFGRTDHALLIDCREERTEHVPLNDPGVAVLIANSNVKHELSGGEYAARREQCEQAVAAMRIHRPDIRSLRDVDMGDVDRIRRDVDNAIYRRARHVVGEIARTEAAARKLTAGDYGGFGQLMYESHRSLRDDLEVSCAELDALVEIAAGVDGVFGSRMTGGGFGGCTVTLVREDQVHVLAEKIVQQYAQRTGRRATCFATRPAGGAVGWRIDGPGG